MVVYEDDDDDKIVHNKGDDLPAKNVLSSTTQSQLWAGKQIRLEAVPKKIPNGSCVYIGSCAATAESVLQAMVDDWQMADIQIVQIIPGGSLPHLSERVDSFRTSSFYSFTRGAAYFSPNENGEGLQDYTPVTLEAVPRLLKEKKLKVDVAIVKCTKPQKGFVSLGVGVDVSRDFIRHAKIVIAQVNDNMPWTEGHSKIPVSDINWWVEKHEPLLTTAQLWPELFKGKRYATEVLDGIGRNVSKEISDGDTLRFGVSPMVTEVLPFLQHKKDLGLHTDILTHTMYEWHEQGVITNKFKTIDTGRTVVSQAHGEPELYDFVDRNPVIEFQPSSYVCSPQTLAKIDNLVSVVAALKVDLTGQVATDSIAHRFYGGVWSDDDSIRGARFSKGGKPIVILPSKSLSGRSNLVFALPPGTGVAITRADVEFVITEYGTANLYGKSIRERCLALIDIAHPEFRQELLDQAKANRYLSKSQPGKSFGSIYPAQFECLHKTKTGKDVLVRPIKAVDEDGLRDFFHKLSDHSVYLRYFRMLKSMPQRILQKTADIDYSDDMAIVVLSPPNAYQHEIVGIAQWIRDPRGGHSEVAFQVRDDWQGEGLGSYLFQRLIQIAREAGLTQLKADVLADNKAMNKVFKTSGVSYTTRSDFGAVTYIFDLEIRDETKE